LVGLRIVVITCQRRLDRCCNEKCEILFVSTIVIFIATTLASTGFAQLDFGITEGVVEDAVDESPWSGSFAAGLNGKTGNSQNLDINTTLNAVRETDINKTALLASYFYAANDVSTVTDRFFGQARRERNLPNPRWTAFVQAQYEWDRFKSFDYRLALHGGLGFEVFKDEDRFLKLRRMFALHKYDSTPVAGDEETDLDYGLAIVVGF